MKNKISLFTAFLLVCISASAYAQQNDHLVALYLFDEEGGDQAVDSSGKNNHGDIMGGAKRVDGKFGGGIEFNGTDAFVEIPDNESLSLETGFTIAMWGYWNSYSNSGGVGVTKERAYKVGVRDHGRSEIRFSTPGFDWNNVVDSNTEVPLEEWHHVAATYDSASGDCFAYFDGQEDGTGNFEGEVIVTADSVWIGRGLNPYFNGIYDEVAIWDVALSNAEILESMESLHAVDAAGKLATVWGKVKMGLLSMP